MPGVVHLDAEITDEELEIAPPPSTRRRRVPTTLVGWLVVLTLVLCVAGLAAQRSAISEELQLHRLYSASQFATMNLPNTQDASTWSDRSAGSAPSSGRDASEAGTEGDGASSPTPPTELPDNTRNHVLAEAMAGDGSSKKEEELRPRQPPLLLSARSAATRDESLPPKVHALWIGDRSLVEQELMRYTNMGFELFIHNSVDAILEDFAPHVRAAYKLAIPRVVSFDFLKLLLLYKHGGLIVDADTYPVVPASQVTYADECHLLFGKEAHLAPWQFSSPVYRKVGINSYGLSRPYQLLNWAMLAREPRNPHVAALIDGSMRHFFGLRDMEKSVVQDVAGSGLMSDYVALLYAEHGRDFIAAFNDLAPAATVSAVDGICMLENELRGGWIHHNYLGSWQRA